MALTHDAAQLLAAVGRFADEFDTYTCNDLGPKLTCQEAEAMWRVLMLAGQQSGADALILAHVEGDDEGDADHGEIVGPSLDRLRLALQDRIRAERWAAATS